MTSLHSFQYNKVFGPWNPENDDSDSNGGCHSNKPMVYRKRGFHDPDREKLHTPPTPPPPWACEMGTICQIGVFTGKRFIVWGPNRGHFRRFRAMFSMNVAQILSLISSLIFCSAKSPQMAFFFLGSAEKKKRKFDKWHPFHVCTPPSPPPFCILKGF